MTDRLYANEAATAAINKMKATDSSMEMMEAYCDFLVVVDDFTREPWIQQVIDRVEDAYEVNFGTIKNE